MSDLKEYEVTITIMHSKKYQIKAYNKIEAEQHIDRKYCKGDIDLCDGSNEDVYISAKQKD